MEYGFHSIDYRGRPDLSVLDELRELLLTRREDVYRVDVYVDSEKFAKKIETYANVVECPCDTHEKDGSWVVSISPPMCKAFSNFKQLLIK